MNRHSLLSSVLMMIVASFSVTETVAAQRRPSRRDFQAAEQRAKALQGKTLYSEALAERKQALLLARQVFGARHPIVAKAALELGQLHALLGNLQLAEPLYQEAMRVTKAQRVRNDPNVGVIHGALGRLSSRLGQIAAAERHYTAAIRILSANRWTRSVSVMRFNMATMYRNAGLSLRSYARRVSDQKQRARIESEALVQTRKAEKLLREELAAVRRSRRQANDYREHNRESVLGEVCLDLGDVAEADRLFSRAKAFSDRVTGKDVHGRDLITLGLSRCALGRYAEAADLFARAATRAQDGLGELSTYHLDTLALQARALAHLGRIDQATRLMDRCLRLERRYVMQVGTALSETEQLSFLSRRGYGEQHLDLALALALDGRGGPDLAARSAEWLLNGKAVAHELLAERTLLLRDATRPETAGLAKQLRAVRAKIAALVPRMRSAKGKVASRLAAELSDLVIREAEVAKALGRATGRTERKSWFGIDEIRRSIPAGSVLVEMARFEAPAFGSRGTSALVGHPRYAAWMIPAAGEGVVTVVDLGPAAALEAAIASLRADLPKPVKALQKKIIDAANATLQTFAKSNKLTPADPAYQKRLRELSDQARRDIRKALAAESKALSAAYRSSAAACARLALHPLMKHIGKTQELILSPDAHLWLVPWGALPTSVDGPYLVETCTLWNVVTGRDVLRPTGGGETASAPVVMGSIDYDAGIKSARDRKKHPVAFLKWSATEVRGVTPHLETYTGMKPRVFMGAAATEQAFKSLRSPKVLFLSTHGVFGSVDENTFRPGRKGLLLENPMLRCQLSLAGSNRRLDGRTKNDGRLLGIEIQSSDLRGTDLVVLSACQTGLGDVHAGQSAAGLRQAFQLAGARSVLATLWSVDDRATTTLTVAFTKRLAAGGSKSVALRGAQLALLRDRVTAHPFFWGAFALTGN